jgi:hypothetical protein
MAWTEDWTVQSVAQNFRVLGKAGLDPEDVVQLIEDSKKLSKLTQKLDDAGVFQLDDEWAKEIKHIVLEHY